MCHLGRWWIFEWNKHSITSVFAKFLIVLALTPGRDLLWWSEAGICLQSGHVRDDRCGNPRARGSPDALSSLWATELWWWSNDDSFYVRHSLMSNGPIITGECKQEKTLHTDMGLVLEQVFVVVSKTAGSCVCFMCVCAIIGSSASLTL